MALTLMQQHGLHTWTFKFDRAVGRFGLTKFGPNIISLSGPITERVGENEVRLTILHEIAHALAGFKAGHGPAWKRVCREIGGDAERLCSGEESTSAMREIYRYQMLCPTKRNVVGIAHRLGKNNKRSYCKCCKTGVIFVDKKEGREFSLM